jgi:hypothetical protein
VCYTNVGGIDVAINVEVGYIAVFFLANMIGQPADGKQVRGAIEVDAIFKREAFARQNFVGDRLQSGVGKNQFAQA